MESLDKAGIHQTSERGTMIYPDEFEKWFAEFSQYWEDTTPALREAFKEVANAAWDEAVVVARKNPPNLPGPEYQLPTPPVGKGGGGSGTVEMDLRTGKRGVPFRTA